MRSFIPVIATLLFAMSGMALAQESAEEAPELPDNIDVRFLVDVSGSMERTDPENLRSAAIPMLAELMPDGAESGLWTFGRYVNMLVPLDEVDDQWRQRMRDARSRIGSPGQYTHIGRALETATNDFWPGGGYDNTHVVLLTDGMVDVPEGEEASRDERERILDEVLGHFQEHGAKLHTLALSDEADQALLERLATETGGHHAVARSDTELIRAFLAAFGAASPTEEVPLENDGFAIDDSVDEFTALIFREAEAESAELVDPEGDRVTRDSLPDGARWHRAETYDLVTIPDPRNGRWEVDAMVGPDSRIKVVSELRMAASDLPARFFASDILDLEVAFYEDGERLTDEDFLGVMDVRAEIRNEGGDRQGTVQLSGDGVPSNGVFNGEIATLTEPGQYEVRIIGESDTFQRSQRQDVILRPPFDTEVQGHGTGDDTRWSFRVIPRDPGLADDSIEVEASVTDPEGDTRTRVLEPAENGSDRTMTLQGEQGEGTYRVQLDMQAETQDGRPISLSTPAFEATFPRSSETGDYQMLEPEAREPEPAPEPEPEPEQDPEPLFDPEPVQEPEPETSEPEEKPSKDAGFNWLLWGGMAAGTGIAAALGAGVWWWLRRRGQSGAKADETEDIPKAGDEETASDQEEPAMEAELEPEADQAQPEEAEPEQDKDEGTSLAEAAAAYQAQQPDAATGDEPEAAAAEPADETAEDTLEPEPEPDEAIPTVGDTEAAEATEPEVEPDPAATGEDEVSDSGGVEAPDDADDAGEDEEAIPTVGGDEDVEDPEALADQILEENQEDQDNSDDEFSLEDFDISEFDDLPDQGSSGEEGDDDAHSGDDNDSTR
ncbi:MAG: VWA domain-containing protein [Pseudomonadota bacterium]